MTAHRTPAAARLAWAEAHAHALGGLRHMIGPLVAAHTAPDLPLNTAWHDGTTPLTAAHLQDLEAFCAAHHQVPTVHVLSPFAAASLPALNARSYELSGVLNAYLHNLEPLPLPPALPVAETTDPDEWAHLSAQGFGPGSLSTMLVVARTPGTRLFTAQLHGEAAGSAALAVHEGVGALFGMSTLPAARGQGVQTALLAARVHAAAQTRADLASVFVTPGTPSERNILRAGFRLAALRLTFTRQPAR
ncbi:GNAT family N-acetyltransferase [Deinococcus taeanensis]|uniref:GNAT family N-acetyltransferase n=1 Tax=Deinococcus taeanensis TaxID=2737050 RepID=UPI001CDBE740|nr:GNAT family N-acetyltransferase [Deinococcus taeanensis]UBV43070.1 GNAT family N-acetyltransferase [Deinococcus taeanensis]